MEAHSRHLKAMNLGRNLILRDVEDAEIRIILSGKQFNARSLAEENAKTKALKAEAAKRYNRRVFEQLVVNQKEIEQLREEHLLQLKHMTRVRYF